MPAEKTHSQWPLIIGLFAINVFWGGSFIANAIALKSIGPIEIASIRFFIAAPLLLVITLLWKGPGIFRVERKDLSAIFAMSLTGVTLQYIIQVTAQSYTTAINASLLINTSTFFILFLGAAFLGEQLTTARVIGAFIGFGGVALLVSGGTLSFSLGQAGDLMILACAFLWAIYSIIGKKIAGKYHPLTVLNWIFIVGTICMAPFYLMTSHAGLEAVPMVAWGAILFLAICCSIIAYLVYNVALETMDASRVAIFIYVVPLSTIVLSWLVLDEGLTLASGIGGLLVLAGMYIAERKTNTKEQASKAMGIPSGASVRARAADQLICNILSLVADLSLLCIVGCKTRFFLTRQERQGPPRSPGAAYRIKSLEVIHN